MDAMAFGMGSSCLQVTFSTKCLDHARYVYDQLNVISPILLALTAGTPFYKGKVSDWDVRWKIIGDSVDDRTPEERDPEHPDYIPTSRYNEANYYLWNDAKNLPEYNDFYTGVKEEDVVRVKQLAESEGVEIDDRMAFHIANIFKRDFLIVHRKFREMSTDEFILFEMLNGTNWNSVRLKIPIDGEIGWRVEFRTMEVQLTAD
jgi:glutamate--cysteine ligase catalytic subunit